MQKRAGRSSSRYLGVWQDQRGTWRAYVHLDRRMRHLGAFESEKQAAIVHDRVARYYRISPERLNFPNLDLSPASVEEVYPERRRHRATINREAQGLIGVARLSPRSKRWCARLGMGNTVHELGIWSTVNEAALAYDRAFLHYVGHRSKRKLNFPEEAKRLGPLDAEALAAEARYRYKKGTTSRFRGVWWCSTQQTFKARLTVNRKIYDLGRFQDEESAAQAYDRQALQLLRAKAKLNFHPDTGEELRGRQVKPTRKVRLSSHSCTGQARLERDK